MSTESVECDEWGPIEEEYKYVEFDIESLSHEELIKATAEEMLVYLTRSWLEVDIDKENCLRKVVNFNTQWYSDFCAAYTKYYRYRRNGKPTKNRLKRNRTFIKRCHTISALKRMAAGNSNGTYAERLMDFVDEFWSKYSEGY